MNLTAVMNIESEEPYFTKIGNLMLSWVSDSETATDQDLRMLASIRKIQGNTEWYDPTKDGEEKNNEYEVFSQ